ncbi:WD40 repeat-like protein [Venturia nashicola]|uniref:Elongator complex protein 2 n=1 Tax=Venturia nashicola TaxID=86259 RepID=A0A4Z1P3G2_9PEZI|nr:WD40 repeat-like protein [Venturia nashicola]
MPEVLLEYISAGGNRHPEASDWDRSPAGLLAFGADNNIAIWNPLASNHGGISSLLSGHTGLVNAVKFSSPPCAKDTLILSGSVDKTVRIWRKSVNQDSYVEIAKLEDHQSSVNCIAVLPNSDSFVTGSADGTVKYWKISIATGAETPAKPHEIAIQLIQSITLTPKFFPLSAALAPLDDSSVLLAVAGTKTIIQIYALKEDNFSLVATLTGHEGWIRSLAISKESKDGSGDLLLASASQDRYIRLWRIHQGQELPAASRAANDPALGVLGKSLSNKAHRFEANKQSYSVTFEALLLGHEDWIYTADWHRKENKLQLLSASADSSLAIWEADESSGIWICVARLGEISAQKGSTSATGSTGGFWAGHWSPQADVVVSLGRTGSWRLWRKEPSKDQWIQDFAATGHVKEVKGVTWSRNGSYLLSTSTDQTTRLYAQWVDGANQSWHEFSRPQIHGYDLNCIDTITDTQFISGADEKLLRVFDEPEAIADILSQLCGIKKNDELHLPDAANIPVLGLSNKAIEAVEDDEIPVFIGDARDAPDPASIIHKSTLKISRPPNEDHLARHMLWPETEKLYGHGYEISTVATNHDGKLIATSCRASSIDHAIIRIYETKEWREIKPPLKAHSLTVTGLEFSADSQYLLSVGRDRQWTIFERGSEGSTQYKMVHSNPKGHSRMILAASWAPVKAGRIFATAGRDKMVRIWKLTDGKVECAQTISAPAPVTAVAFLPRMHRAPSELCKDAIAFSYGLETGAITIIVLDVNDLALRHSMDIQANTLPSKVVNQLSWRPFDDGAFVGPEQLAAASDDASVRLYSVKDLF